MIVKIILIRNDRFLLAKKKHFVSPIVPSDKLARVLIGTISIWRGVSSRFGVFREGQIKEKNFPLFLATNRFPIVSSHETLITHFTNEKTAANPIRVIREKKSFEWFVIDTVPRNGNVNCQSNSFFFFSWIVKMVNKGNSLFIIYH